MLFFFFFVIESESFFHDRSSFRHDRSTSFTFEIQRFDVRFNENNVVKWCFYDFVVHL